MTGPVASVTPSLQEVIARVSAESRTVLECEAVTTSIEWTASRPYSDVARVRYSGGQASGTFYAKVFRPRAPGQDERDFMAQRVKRDFEVTARLYREMRRHESIAVPRPLACYPELLAVVTEAAPGVPLLDVLESEGRFRVPQERLDYLRDSLARVGRWVKVFQDSGPTSPTVEYADVATYIDLRLQRLVAHPSFAFTESDRAAVLSAIEATWPALAESDRVAVPLHADMALGNILVARSGVTVLDLAMTSGGTRFHDVAHLFMQLDLLTAKPSFRRSTVSSLQRALLDGYEPGVSDASPLFRIMLLQHVVCHASGLLHRPAGRLARLYNRWVLRRHLAFLRAFAAAAPERNG